jgi:hypothetical protein
VNHAAKFTSSGKCHLLGYTPAPRRTIPIPDQGLMPKAPGNFRLARISHTVFFSSVVLRLAGPVTALVGR